MARNKKRKLEHDSGNELYNQRNTHQTEEARIDPTYGQRSAIPGLDNAAYFDDEGDLNYDDDMDALSYLRSVRQEATSIPNLLVAPKQPTQQGDEPDRTIYNDGTGDHRGWYEGGAYVAAPEPQLENTTPDGEDSGDTLRDPQLVYFDSILTRFEVLRNQLSRTPPPEVVENLDANHPTYLPTNSSKEVFGKWNWLLKNVEPVPAQLATINKGAAFRLLGMLTRGTLLKRGVDISGCISRWLWGLLARVPESGELTNVEISIIRELGKKAVLVGVGFKERREWYDGMNEVEADFDEGHDQQLDYEVVNEDEVVLDEDDGDLEIDEDASAAGKESDGPSLYKESDPNTSVIDTAISDDPTNAARAIETDSKKSNEQKIESVQPGTKLDDGSKPGGETVIQYSPEEFAAAKARIISKLSEESKDTSYSVQKQQELDHFPESSPTLNTRATLDMILTVAGELYGQRDLLEFREMWAIDA